MKVNKLTRTEKLDLDQPISKTEYDTVIKNLKTGKSPGLDGITPEFYKHFWDDLYPPFSEMVTESFIAGHLPESVRMAVVQLIFKKDNPHLLKNYRPISLTNCDYTIIAFILSNRIQNIIHNLVSNDQTAYVKNRFIGNNVRLLTDILDYCDLNNKNGILLSVDFGKAFDTVEWNFVHQSKI